MTLYYYTNSDGYFHSSTENRKETIWIHVENPNSDEIDSLLKDFQLPKDYLTDILDDDENSRYESRVEGATLLLIQYPVLEPTEHNNSYLDTYPFALILTPDRKIITVANHPVFFLDELIAAPTNDEDVTSYLIFNILWGLAKSFNFYLRSLIIETDSLEHQLLKSTENKQLVRMIELQKSLVYFEAALESNLKVLYQVYNSDKVERGYLHLRVFDVIVETKQALTSTQIQIKLLENIGDMFSSIVSNNLNIVMKILTSLTIVLTIPTIVGGIYGMNVKLPFENNSHAFYYIIGFTLLFSIVVIRLLRKKNLL